MFIREENTRTDKNNCTKVQSRIYNPETQATLGTGNRAKTKGQSRMDYPETLVTLDTHDTGDKTNKNNNTEN